MSFSLSLLAGCLLLSVVCCRTGAPPRHEDAQETRTKTMVLVVDGVRWDDPETEGLEGLQAMAKHGVRARHVNPVYPSSSIPNLYSIVTGLYSENHGLVLDNLEENAASRDEGPWAWWRDAEPIWSAAEREDIHTAVHYFPGACRLPPRAPSKCTPFANHPSDREVRRVIWDSLKDMEEDILDFVIIRYGLVQHFGVLDGPDSPSRLKALESFDRILHDLQKNLTHGRHDKKVNLVVVSSHGMTGCDKATSVDLGPFRELIQEQLGHGAFSFLRPVSEQTSQLISELKAWHSSAGIRIYKRSQIPEKYRLRRHPKIPPLLLQARKGHYILPLLSTGGGNTSSTTSVRGGGDIPVGCHGYDPDQVTDMRTIFLARGPAFLKGHVSEHLRNTDHYNLLCHLLDIAPSPNNGSWEKVARLLDEGDEDEDEDDDEEDYDDDYSEEDDDRDVDDDGKNGDANDVEKDVDNREESEPEETDPDDKDEEKNQVPRSKTDSSNAVTCSPILVLLFLCLFVSRSSVDR